MRNRNKSVYVIDGDAKEVKELYELMKDLGSRKEPFIKNGFGTKWLGCMVDALGKERKNRDVSFIVSNNSLLKKGYIFTDMPSKCC